MLKFGTKNTTGFKRPPPLFLHQAPFLSDDEVFKLLSAYYDEGGVPKEPNYPLVRQYPQTKMIIVGQYCMVVQEHLNDPDVQTTVHLLRGYDPDIEVYLIAAYVLGNIKTDLEEVKKGNLQDRQLKTEVQEKVAELFERLNKLGTSDLHIVIKTKERKAKLRYRAGGQLKDLYEWATTDAIRFVTGAANNSSQKSNSFDLSSSMSSLITNDNITLPEGMSGIRCQFKGTTDGHFAVFRFLGSGDVELSSLEDSGFNKRQLIDLRLMQDIPAGINFITGPTGEGKSRTLATFAREVLARNDSKYNLITIESPVEYPIPGANQIEVKDSNDGSDNINHYAQAIKTALRMDPDRLGVGELRDLDAAKATIAGALTGHPVETTLHVNDALTVPLRLEDMGVEKYLAYNADVIKGFVAQRLVQVLCENCKTPNADHNHVGDVPHRLQDALEPLIGAGVDIYYKNQGGCEVCKQRGYTGRTLVSETVITSDPILKALETRNKAEAQRLWLESGGQTMMEHALERIIAGTLDPRLAEKKVGHLSVDMKRLEALGLIDPKVRVLQ